MFDRSKPKQSEPSASSPDSKMAHAQGSYMNSEQFCMSKAFLVLHLLSDVNVC